MANVFDLANFYRRKDTFNVRQERIKREGSPYYTWQVPATAPGGTSVINVNAQFPLSRKYAPLDWLELANNDAVDLTARINNNDSFACPAGTIRTIDNIALHYIAVTNDHATTTSTLNKITITLQKQPLTMDKWIRG